MEQKQPAEAKEWFEETLKTVLQSLYDPAVLRSSPLAAILGEARRGDPVSLLRNTLLEGIEALKPGHNTPRDSRTWRIYTILRRRYVEQVAQETVAKDMGLSVRQLQREEKVARQVLADHLWTGSHLKERLGEIERFITKNDPVSPGSGDAAYHQEIEHLRESVAYKETDIHLLIQDVLATASPILQINQVVVYSQTQPGGMRAALPATMVRQALLNILAMLSKTFPGGKISIHANLMPGRIAIAIDCQPAMEAADGTGERAVYTGYLLRQYESAIPLVAVCDGSLTVSALDDGNGWRTAMEMPLQRQLPVLVIDDNADALVLMERYLAGSAYRFFGSREAKEILALAAEIHPQVIVLDIMMPEWDGWMVLGQLRENPATNGVPVIVCSILAQKDLALALGAAEFLRKPVSRQGLLAALDRLLASPRTAGG